MEHFEIHALTSVRDAELAVIAGLLQEDFSQFPSVDCQICEVDVKLDQTKSTAYIVVSEDEERISCEPCLGVALTSLMP